MRCNENDFLTPSLMSYESCLNLGHSSDSFSPSHIKEVILTALSLQLFAFPLQTYHNHQPLIT